MKVLRSVSVAFVLVSTASSVQAQESTSAPLAKQLVMALDAAKTDLFAARDPESGDYVSVLYVSGSQMLVVSAKYASPELLDASIAKQEYNEVYMDLNTAGVAGTRTYIEDFSADGLKAVRPPNAAGDSIDSQALKMSFDNDWKKQRLTEETYQQMFQRADQRYAGMLRALLRGLDDAKAKAN